VPTADEIVRDLEALESSGTHQLIDELLAELAAELTEQPQRAAA